MISILKFIHLGITPYIGDYGDIHTWLMIKFDHTPKFKRNLIITPHLRFFKDVHLMKLVRTLEKILCLTIYLDIEQRKIL